MELHRSLRPDTCGVINIIWCKSGSFQFFGGKSARQLANNRTNHFEVSKFLGSDVSKYTGNPRICKRKPLGQIAHGSSHFAIGTTVLTYNKRCHLSIWC